MPRRGENIYKRRDGRWEARVQKPDGKYLYLYAKTYKEVREKKKNYQKYIKPSEKKLSGSDTSAAGLFEFWLQGDLKNQVKPSTYGNYYSCTQKYIIPFFYSKENEYLTELSATQFCKFIREKTELSESYKRKILIIFKTALKEILKGSFIYPGIMEAVKLPKRQHKEVQVFTLAEQRLVEEAACHVEDVRALGIMLTFYTGIRLGELCALKWCDFDYEAGTLAISKTVTRVKNQQHGENKTTLLVGFPKSQRSIRKIPLPKFIIKIFKEYRQQCSNQNYYVISGTNTPIDPRTYQNIYKKVLKVSGVNDRKFHAIRHTFATRALELGVDIKTLSELLGHSNVSITLNIYAHSLMEQKKIAMEKFNEMHFSRMIIAPIAVKGSVLKA